MQLWFSRKLKTLKYPPKNLQNGFFATIGPDIGVCTGWDMVQAIGDNMRTLR